MEFMETLQDLSAALVLVDPEDPGTYQGVLSLLDELALHEFAQNHPDAAVLLCAIQKQVEECLLQPTIYPDRLGLIEEHLKTLQNFCKAPEQTPPPAIAGDDGATFGLRADAERSTNQALGDNGDQSPCSGIPIETDRALYEDFLLEADGYLESIEILILELEQNPQDASAINEIFRPFHTLKGVSGFLNLHDIRRLSHATEDLLDQARKGLISIGKREIDLVLEAVDILRRLLDCVRSWLQNDPAENLAPEVDAFLLKLQPQDGDVPVTANRPDGGPEPPDRLLDISPNRAGRQEQTLQELPLESALDTRDRPVQKQTETAVERRMIESPVQASPAQNPQAASLKQTGTPTVKVDMMKLDNLVNMVGELVIAQSLVQQNPRIRSIVDHSLAKDFGQLARITSELRNTAMTLRMIPIRHTFQRMTRLVRDLAAKSGKSVQIVMSGEDTEIDRNMVDTIYEPLVHLVRNAIDHGLETPEERRKIGKPETGTLQLRSYQRGGNVIIEVADDGRGLDRERIVSKARQLGLIGPDEMIADREVDMLIFRPGFSTASQVTDVSGRGVGMDVVRKTVEDLRGKIEVQSHVGQGTTFVLKLPVTLAIIDGMIVRVGQERFVLPTVGIREVIRPQREDYFTVKGRGEMIRIRGNLLPLIRLHQIFGIDTERTSPWEALVIVAESQGESRCLLVDEILEKQEVVIKSLGPVVQKSEEIAGGSILGDGSVGIILDVNGLFHLHQNHDYGPFERLAAAC